MVTYNGPNTPFYLSRDFFPSNLFFPIGFLTQFVSFYEDFSPDLFMFTWAFSLQTISHKFYMIFFSPKANFLAHDSFTFTHIYVFFHLIHLFWCNFQHTINFSFHEHFFSWFLTFTWDFSPQISCNFFSSIVFFPRVIFKHDLFIFTCDYFHMIHLFRFIIQWWFIFLFTTAWARTQFYYIFGRS